MHRLADRTNEPDRLREVLEKSLQVRMPILRAAGLM